MADKKPKKQTAKKVLKKTVKTPARKSPPRTKPKAVPKRKAVSGKPASQKSVLKKTTGKKKAKQVARQKAGSPRQKTAKETPAARAAKIHPRKAVSAATRKHRERLARMAEEERKTALRRSLIQKREEIVREVKNGISKYIKGETRQLVDTALDDGDWSVVDLSEDISFKHMSTHRENLLKIDEALRKLSEGTYGFCEDCGEEISKARLNILPFAIFCTDCQERREQLEELERREGFIG
ncbi:MAG: hypothetical protein AMK74_04590 [Nitrospira bacterium SM23_35]|nr:MAG: hypothetical protein AMK74_04590 [Nitrospira bacterium SM23_35]